MHAKHLIERKKEACLTPHFPAQKRILISYVSDSESEQGSIMNFIIKSLLKVFKKNNGTFSVVVGVTFTVSERDQI